MSWRQKLVAATDRLTSLEAERLHVHVDFPLFQRLAPPIPSGRSQIPGIQIQDTRRMRLLEVLLHGGPPTGWLAERPDAGGDWERLHPVRGNLPVDPTAL